MNPRTKRTLIIALVVIIVLMLAFLIWWQFFRKVPVTNTNVTNQPAPNANVVVVNTVTNANQNTNTQSESLAIIRLANLFVERLGSFSSESQYQNVLDLKRYMTKTMQTWADNYVKAQKAQPATGGFSSIVTKVISTKIVSQASAAASIRVTTQRREEGIATNTNSQVTYYQDIILDLTKEGSAWLVNSADWQAKQ